MKRRRILLLAGLPLLAALAFLVWPRGPTEPDFEGTPITVYIRKDQSTHIVRGGSDVVRQEQATREALYATRSNALPYLLHQFTVRDSTLALTLRRMIANVSSKPLRPDPVQDALFIGWHGIEYLGTNATPGLPVLAGYIDDPERAYAAVSAMKCCGAAALPFLLKAAASTNNGAASGAANVLAALARRDDSVIPTMVALTAHTGDWVRVSAVRALVGIQGRPDLTVPALITALSDTNPPVPMHAMRALTELKSAARPAVPALRPFLTNWNVPLARAASNALHQIDPAAFPAPPPP